MFFVLSNKKDCSGHSDLAASNHCGIFWRFVDFY